mgnify:CR=1 FL=1
MEKYGLLGEKLGHSYSKEIHEIFFELTGKNANYQMIERQSDEIGQLMEEIKKGKFKGINVTIPYKVEVIKYLDEVSKIAKQIGAVNTVTCKNGKLIGDNSDYFGFLKTLELNNIDVNGKKVLVLGTGGASKAIYNALIDNGAKNIYLATIIENDPFKVRTQDRLIHYSAIGGLRNIELIVNCTPVGMYPAIDNCPLERKNLIDTNAVVDIVYNPEETVLMTKYKLKGVKVTNGLIMLISQAIKSEEIWHDEEYGTEILEEIHKRLSEKLYK